MAKAASPSTPGAHGALQTVLGGGREGTQPPLSCKKPLWKEGIMSCSLAMGSSMTLCSQSPGSLDGDHPNPGDSWEPPSLPGLDEAVCPSLSRVQLHHLQDQGYGPCPCHLAGCQHRVMLDPQPSSSPVPAAPSPGTAELQPCSLCP